MTTAIRGVVAVALALSSTAAAAADGRPVVVVKVEVTAGNFETNIREALPGVQVEVARRVGELAQTHFGYLRWVAGRDAGGLTPAARLTLAVVDDAPFPGSIGVRYAASIGGGERFAMSRLPAEELYSLFDDPPTHRPQGLAGDLDRFVSERFANESFRDALQEQFLAGIPLTQVVEAERDRHAIWLPVSAKQLNSDQGSVLRVKFFAVTEDDLVQEGHILMRSAGDVAGDGGRGGQHCSVVEFSFVPHEARAWDEAIPEVVRPQKLREVFVYMIEYVQRIGGRGTAGSQADEL